MSRYSAFIALFIVLIASPTTLWAESEGELQAALENTDALPGVTDDEKTELTTFYAQRGYKPAWNLSDDEAIKKITAFIESVDALVTYHGLIRSGYEIPAMQKLALSKSDPDKQRLEFLITESLLHLAHDLHGDNVDLEQLYTGWTMDRQDTDLSAQLQTALSENKLEAFFDKISPQNQEYKDLARALQDYRAIAAKGAWPLIPAGPSMKPASEVGENDPNVKGPRVGLLRRRLAMEGYTTTDPLQGSDFFDDGLKKALMDYQTKNGLSPDGHAGGKTLESLDGTVASRIMQIRANMERWRHVPEDFPPDRYTIVNIPDYSVTIVEDSAVKYRGIVIVGKDDRQTPFIDSKIVNTLFNPSWHVPVSIARKDILPKLRKNSHYLEKIHAVIADREVDPEGFTIDWKHMSDDQFNYRLRQEPGDLNSLGQIKLNFSNPFDVYMHGTPHQELFQKAERDFSSGCVRMEDPVRVAEIMLEDNKDKEKWTQDRINQEIDGGETHFVTLAKPMPIYFLYWTVFTTDDGQLNFRKDIYGYDLKLINEMNKETSSGGESSL